MRRCYLCDETKPATLEHFPKDKNRMLGIGYQCRPCALRVRREKGDKRKNRWSTLMTPEQRKERYKIARRYYHGAGRPNVLLAAYRNSDKKRGIVCDIDVEWFRANIESKPCFYCGDVEDKRGCDRLDNSLGHTKDNVVACCALCNHTRTNRFTSDEMEILGRAIRKIRRERRTQNA